MYLHKTLVSLKNSLKTSDICQVFQVFLHSFIVMQHTQRISLLDMASQSSKQYLKTYKSIGYMRKMAANIVIIRKNIYLTACRPANFPNKIIDDRDKKDWDFNNILGKNSLSLL